MRTTLERFALDRRGSIGLYMAVAILPITLLIGAATDFRRIETVRSEMQDATDAAILAGAKAYLAAGETNPNRLEAARQAAGATLTGNADFNPSMVTDLTWDVNHAGDGGGELVLTSRAKAPLAFGGLFGMSSVPVSVSAASVVELRLEVALVLDTTGSMSERNRIGWLKTATAQLVDQLDAAARQSSRTDPLKIALVPYSNTVRLSKTFEDAPWFDTFSSGEGYWKPGMRPAEPIDRFRSYPAGWGGCVETRPMPYDVQDTPPNKADPDTLFVPFFNTETPTTDPNKDCGLSEIVPLTRDAGRIKTAAAAMRTDGFTNIPIGLVWGWHALTPDDGPFGPGAAEPYGKADLVKAVVLMTDGSNNLGSSANEYHGTGRMDQNRVGADETSTFTQRRDALNARLALLCKNMKARGIVIYSVRVEVDDEPDTLMRECATQRKNEPAKFWDVKSADQLPAVFNKIGQELIEVRLSR